MENLLILFIELRCLLIGDDYILLKRFGDCIRRPNNPATSEVQDRGTDQRILEVANKITKLLTGEVPIRCQDVAVYFSLEEWEYVEGHKDLYKDIIVDNELEGDQNTIGQTVSEKVDGSQAVDLDEDDVIHRILHLTEEVIHLLTKEKYILIWSLGNRTTHGSSDHVPDSPLLLVHERNKDEKILDLTNKIIQLLTGEVPIRYNDIKICFSKEEWEYVTRQKDRYKDVMRDYKILDNYDMSSSTKYKGEKPQKPPRSRANVSESLPTNEGPPQVAETFPLSNSGEYSKGRPNLTRRKKSQKQQASVPCSKCGKPFKEGNIVRVMDQTGVSGSTSEARCNVCGPCLLESSRSDKRNRPFPCTECISSFSSKYTLRIHMRVHTLENIFTCPECGKIVTDAHRLETHRRVHTGEKPYKCSECDKSFSNTGNLNAHYRVHTGEKPFRCSECDKTFRYKSHLVSHQRYHTGQTLPCPECGQLFVYQSHLVKHLLIHTGEKPYKCSECGKGFNRSTHLAQHVMIHTGEILYECVECDRRFLNSSHFTSHQRLHIGEKPYSCSECGKGFIRRTHLTKHKKVHTREKPYPCPQCGKHFPRQNSLLKHLKRHSQKKS